MLPVSLHVLEAGEGGGGISNLSAFSLFEEHLVDKLAKKQKQRLSKIENMRPKTICYKKNARKEK